MGHDIGNKADCDQAAVLNEIRHLRYRALALARNRADADDLVQDTLERALRALPGLRPGSRMGAWMGTMMNHRFIDGWRRARNIQPLETADNVVAPDPDPPQPWLDLTEAEIARGMQDLPLHCAEILRLRYTSGLSYPQIARRLGISNETVGTRLFRARRRLRRILIARYLAPHASPREILDGGLRAA
jgi:RNA polymerase sigma-70 factor (ECF subfamily)